MSSIQDRIRRLQSADDAASPADAALPRRGAVADAKASLQTPAPPPVAPVSARATHFTGPPSAPSPAAATTAAPRPVAELARVAESNASGGTRAPRVADVAAAFSAARDGSGDATGSGGGGGLSARITRLEAGGDAAAIRDRVRRLEADEAAPRGPLGSRAAAFERADADGAVTGVRGAFEKEGAGVVRGWGVAAADGGGVGGRAAAFDKADVEVEKGKGMGGGGGGGFERRGGEETDTLTLGEAKGVRGRAGLFERDTAAVKDAKQSSAESSKGRDEREEREGVRGRAGAFETPNSETEKAKRTQHKDAAEKPVTLAPGTLAGRAAMFTGAGRDAEKGAKEETTTSNTTKDVQGLAAKQATSQVAKGGGGLEEEVREVKAMNADLVGRLMELTAAFKKLEKSREDLQARVSKLEKK